MLKKGVNILRLIVILMVFTSFCVAMASYPQIIHAESEDVTGGTITCTEFVDINGRKHEGRIPATKLGVGGE